MKLPVGAYRMEVRSEESTPDVAWEHPVYGATSSFTISKAQTTQLEEVVCTLQNIKVTVDYSSELAGMLADTSKATISLGQTSQEFRKPKRARPTSNRWTSRIRWISTSTAFSPTPTSPRSSASRSRESRPASGVRFRS